MSFTYEERDVLMAEIAELRAELAAAKHQAWADKYCLDADTRAIDRLRAEIADLRCDDSCSRTVEELQARAWDAEAAIARVGELCDGPLEPGCICMSCVILRTLNGDTE